MPVTGHWMEDLDNTSALHKIECLKLKKYLMFNI